MQGSYEKRQSLPSYNYTDLPVNPVEGQNQYPSSPLDQPFTPNPLRDEPEFDHDDYTDYESYRGTQNLTEDNRDSFFGGDVDAVSDKHMGGSTVGQDKCQDETRISASPPGLHQGFDEQFATGETANVFAVSANHTKRPYEFDEVQDGKPEADEDRSYHAELHRLQEQYQISFNNDLSALNKKYKRSHAVSAKVTIDTKGMDATALSPENGVSQSDTNTVPAGTTYHQSSPQPVQAQHAQRRAQVPARLSQSYSYSTVESQLPNVLSPQARAVDTQSTYSQTTVSTDSVSSKVCPKMNCGKTFKYFSHFPAHFWFVHYPKYWVCPFCMVTPVKDEAGTLSWACKNKKCSATFSSPQNMVEHIVKDCKGRSIFNSETNWINHCEHKHKHRNPLWLPYRLATNEQQCLICEATYHHEGSHTLDSCHEMSIWTHVMEFPHTCSQHPLENLDTREKWDRHIEHVHFAKSVKRGRGGRGPVYSVDSESQLGNASDYGSYSQDGRGSQSSRHARGSRGRSNRAGRRGNAHIRNTSLTQQMTHVMTGGMMHSISSNSLYGPAMSRHALLTPGFQYPAAFQPHRYQQELQQQQQILRETAFKHAEGMEPQHPPEAQDILFAQGNGVPSKTYTARNEPPLLVNLVTEHGDQPPLG